MQMLAHNNYVDITSDVKHFKIKCKQSVCDNFKSAWQLQMADIDKHPIIRLYRTFKSTFRPELYLKLVENIKYRRSISQLRTSSHMLEIERGRHTKPKTPIEKRVCCTCNVIEDERHFLLHCKINYTERMQLYQKIVLNYPEFSTLNDNDKFNFFLNNECKQYLTWLGKFLFHSFEIRKVK